MSPIGAILSYTALEEAILHWSGRQNTTDKKPVD